MSGKERIGILGGTFDPVHQGHLIIAEEVRDQLGLTSILFVPAREPWRKVGKDVAGAADRLAMVRLAVEGNPGFAVSTVDLDRAGPTYTVDTLLDIQRAYGQGAQRYFILGADALMDLPFWQKPREIAELAQLATVQRHGYPVDWSVLEHALPNARQQVLLLEVPEIGISSTEVRRRVAAGRSIRYWVPPAVAEYIRAHRLYRTV